jgi:hypothetical protein
MHSPNVSIRRLVQGSCRGGGIGRSFGAESRDTLRRLHRGSDADFLSVPTSMTWGQERIADEVLVKFGMKVSPRTVRKYLDSDQPRGGRGDQRWTTFVRNHAKAIVACDFFVSVTDSFSRCLRFRRDGDWLPPNLACQCDRSPKRGMDDSAIPSADRRRPSIPIRDPRPRRYLLEGCRFGAARFRCPRSQDSRSNAHGKRFLRTAHWNDPARVFGFHHSHE